MRLNELMTKMIRASWRKSRHRQQVNDEGWEKVIWQIDKSQNN